MAYKKLIDLTLLDSFLTKIKGIFVSTITYDSTNKKITKTINGTTSDVVTAATLKSAMDLSKSDVELGNVDNVKQYSASNPPPYPVTSVNGNTGAVTVSVPDAGTVSPKMDGTAAVGTSTKYAKEDHVHPYDTSMYQKGSAIRNRNSSIDQAPVYTSFIQNLKTAEVQSGIRAIAGIGNYFYLAHLNPTYTITCNYSDVLYNNLFTNNLSTDCLIPTTDLANNPFILTITSDKNIDATDVTHLAMYVHRLDNKGKLTDYKVELLTTGTNSESGTYTWQTVYERTNVNDNINGLTIALNSSSTYNYIFFKGIRFTISGAIPYNNTNANSFAYNKIAICMFSLLNTRPAFTPANAIGALDQIGGYVYGKTTFYNGIDGDLTGKVNGHTIEANVPSNAVFTDTTYESKTAASGGTNVSLVTTGEKAIWNAKTSNTGTITGITMNGKSKGTSGVVDLGTVITEHQSLTAYRTADAQDAIDSNKEAAGLGLTETSVGDLVRVKTVDANGKPTSWNHVPLCDIVTNENLLDNWYFVGGGSQLGYGVFPINQQGQAQYTGAVAAIDRWTLNSAACNLTLESDALHMSYGSSAATEYIRQLVKSPESLSGKTLTFSAIVKGNCRILLQKQTETDTALGTLIRTDYAESADYTLVSVTGTYPSDLVKCAVSIQGPNNSEFYVQAAKLEIGDYQTLAHNEGTEANPNWIINEIPNYGEELAKCNVADGKTVEYTDRFLVLESTYELARDLTWTAIGGGVAYSAKMNFVYNGATATTVPGYRPVAATIARFTVYNPQYQWVPYIQYNTGEVCIYSAVGASPTDFHASSHISVRAIFEKT